MGSSCSKASIESQSTRRKHPSQTIRKRDAKKLVQTDTVAVEIQQTDVSKLHLTTSDTAQQTNTTQKHPDEVEMNGMSLQNNLDQLANREMQKNDETTESEITSDSTGESYFDIVNDEENEDIAKTKEHYEESYRKGGLGGLYEKINEKLNKWQNVAIRFAVIGESGTGKSSFINAMLGLSEKDEGAAEIGAVETTLVCTEYRHPKYGTTYFVDCPGLGTTKFPKSEYLDTIRFDTYDVFILVTNNRFKVDAIWLAKEIEKQNRAFYFVRTKIDNDLQRVRNQDQVITNIRLKTVEELVANGFNNTKIFLVNSYDPYHFDFNKLNMQLIKDIPKMKKEALVLSLTPSSAAIIADKYAHLSSRIKYVAVAASVGSLVPFPGVGIACEVGVLLAEVKIYKSQFKTDEKSMKEVAEKLNIPVDILYKETEMKTHVIYGTAAQSLLLSLCAELVASEVAENFVKYIPIIGSFIATTASVPVCMHALHKLLKLCRAEAERTLNVFQLRMRSYAV